MVTLLARLDAKTVHWVGTSMGGLIGMGLAGAARLADRAPRPQRRRSGDRRRRHRAHRQLRRRAAAPGPPSRRPPTTCSPISDGFGPHSREQWLALTRPHAAPGRRPLPAPLRPGDRGLVAAASRRRWPPWARRRSGLPTTRSAARRWCCAARVRPAVARHGRGDGAARPACARAGVRRRRPCADARRCRPGRSGAGVPAGAMKTARRSRAPAPRRSFACSRCRKRPRRRTRCARARAFAAPLLQGRELPTGESVLAHADGTAVDPRRASARRRRSARPPTWSTRPTSSASPTRC